MCPTCRGTSTVAMPFRALQPIVDAVIRNAPHKIRAEREREQADEVYKGGLSIRVQYIPRFITVKAYQSSRSPLQKKRHPLQM